MEKLVLNKNWRFLRKGNTVYLINIITSKQLEIIGDQEEALFVLSNLRKGITKVALTTEFLHRFPKLGYKWLTDSLVRLEQQGLFQLFRRRPSPLSEKYLLGLDRQLDFLEEMFSKKGKYEMQVKLKESKIAVLGLGTIAQYTLYSLLSSGVGHFTCVDFDIVEERNIGRQPILRRSDIGKTKAEVVERFLRESRYGLKVKAKKKMIQSIRDVKELIRDCDIVLHCCDYPRFLIHRWINEACLILRKPNLLVYSGRVGPFSIPFKTSCYGCLETFLKKHVIAYDELAELIREEGLGRYPELAVVGGLTGVLAAKEVVAYILGIPPETLNAFLDVSPFSLTVNRHPLPRQKQCYACGKK